MSPLHLLLGCRFGRYLAIAFYRADYGSLVGSSAALARFITFVLAALARLSADIGLIHFYDASQKATLPGLSHCFANLHGDPPSGVLVHVQIARKL